MRKHILFLTTIPPGPGFGPPVLNYRHLNRLQGWRISIIAERRLAQKTYAIPKSWEVILLSTSLHWWPQKLSFLISECERIFNKEKPSAILNHFGTNSIFAYHLSKRWDIPLSIMLHDQWEIWVKSWVERFYMRRGWDKIILNHASRIWTYSRELADIYPVQNCAKIKIIRPIPEGNSARFFTEWRDEFKKNPVVAFAGSFRLHEVKYFKIVASALDKIGGKLILTTTKNSIVKILLKGLSNVEFREPTSDNESLIRFLKERASCLLVPWCFELDKLPWRKFGFPSKFSEFIQIGLPVIILAPQGVPISNCKRWWDF
ncbi:MAG: hypothetical protein NC828_01875 [Candidatus Omnitrophica bacterium]|nr:hypothetical protein [Candidatus Omnitrophota bacterium]